MKKDKKVLLAMNPQNGFKNKHTEKSIQRVDEIIDYFDVKFISLFHNPDKSMYKEHLHWHNFSKHKHQDYFDIAIKNTSNSKFVKNHKYNNITWQIKTYIKMNKIKTVYLCGVETDAGVYKTALELFDMGVKPIIIKDACGSRRGKKYHDMGITLAERQIGEDNVLTFDELKDKLEHKVVEILM